VPFHAEEIGEEACGYNVPVAPVTAALAAKTEAETRITRFTQLARGVALDGDTPGTVTLEDGQTLSAHLIIGAEGRNSISREAAGIGVNLKTYPQTAMALNLAHTRPHDHISTEFHRKTGPFTIVPLEGLRSALVWVERPEDAERFMAMDAAALAREIEPRTHGLLGRVTLEGTTRGYPPIHQTANAVTAPGLALVGEAAHVMPPIGAQGLNLGLRDVAALRDSLADSGALQAPGAHNAREIGLAAYARNRRVDIGTRMAAVDILNRSLLSGFIGLQGARSAGLHLVRRFGPLRRLVMREGLQPGYATPGLMRAGGAS